MLKGFLIACVVAMTLGALAGFAMPADAAASRRGLALRPVTSHAPNKENPAALSGRGVLRQGRCALVRAHRELDADDPRIADEAGIVVEVDAALQIGLVGDVAGIGGDFVILAREIVADPETAFVIAVGVELRRLVEEEVGVALQPPIGIGEDLAAVLRAESRNARSASACSRAPAGTDCRSDRALPSRPPDSRPCIGRRSPSSGLGSRISVCVQLAPRREQQIVGRRPFRVGFQAVGQARRAHSAGSPSCSAPPIAENCMCCT